MPPSLLLPLSSAWSSRPLFRLNTNMKIGLNEGKKSDKNQTLLFTPHKKKDVLQKGGRKKTTSTSTTTTNDDDDDDDDDEKRDA
jgi:hypothetical protein